MTGRRVGLVLAAATLAASGTYVFVYLYRWEWNRALISSALFIAAEAALVGMVLARRLRSVQERLDELGRSERRRVARVLRDNAPPARVTFEWLTRPEHLGVFVPVLLGAGLVLSALAWVVERVARATARSLAETGLASRLAGLGLPPRGLLDGGDDRLALLRGPAPPAGGRR